MDALNAMLALIALGLAGVAIFVTRDHRHNLVCLGVPIAGIIIALIPLVRVMWLAHTAPPYITTELAEERPCSPRGDPSEYSDANTIRPLDLLMSNVSSLALGVLGSFLASFLYESWHRHVSAAARRSAGGR